MANAHDRAARLKRGGNLRFVPIASSAAKGRYSAELGHNMIPERPSSATGHSPFWPRCSTPHGAGSTDSARQDCRLRDAQARPRAGNGAVPYSEVAARLGMAEGAVKVVVHRLRNRLQGVTPEQIAATVDEPAEVDDEVRALFSNALG